MKYIKYEDLLNNHQLRIMEVELKPKAKITEVEWFNHMVSGIIIKTADTIEELCDGEIIVWKDSIPSIWNKFLSKQEFEHLYSSFQRKKIIAIYGAIWTDKGLIYVAKMNEKGELELL